MFIFCSDDIPDCFDPATPGRESDCDNVYHPVPDLSIHRIEDISDR